MLGYGHRDRQLGQVFNPAAIDPMAVNLQRELTLWVLKDQIDGPKGQPQFMHQFD